MKMNTLEKVMMNSFIRVMILTRFEAPLLRRLGGDLHGLNVLEIGCGRGHSTRLLIEQFGAASVVAVDIDAESVMRARHNLSGFSSNQVQVLQGDVASLELPDHSFDAVVDFAALHHVPDWQKGVSEVSRVLKPGGRFLFEEVTRQWLNGWFARLLLLHPNENRFSAEEFVAQLEKSGFSMMGELVRKGNGDFVFGSARKGDSA